MHATFYIFNGIWYLNGASWFTYYTFLRLVAPCVDKRHPWRTSQFHRGRQSDRFLPDFCLQQNIPDHLILLQNCHKHNSSLQFHCRILTSMVVGSMSQNCMQRFHVVVAGRWRARHRKISSSHEIVGKVHNNVQLVIQIWVINTSRWPNGPMWRQRSDVLLCFIYVTHTEGPHMWNFADYWRTFLVTRWKYN